jgi:Mn-dependent DtxR family transcriptional regulator
MPRKSITELIEEIKRLLEKEGELSTRQIALKTKTQWRTTKKALDTLRNLGIINERQTKMTERDATLYSIKK